MRHRHVPRRARPSTVLAASLVALALVASVAGCRSIMPTRATDTVERELEVAAGTPVRVVTFNGGVDVATEDGNRVTAVVERTGEGATQAEADADVQAIAVTLELEDGVAVLKAVYTPSPNSVSGARGASVTIRVPATTPLVLATSNGGVEVRDTAADVEARTSNGSVDLRGVAGTITVETSNGAVAVAATDALVDIHTSNGALTFTGSLLPGMQRLETSNGQLTMRLPASAAFAIDATTSSGSVSSDFAIEGETDDTSLHGIVAGGGDTTIVAHSSNGDLVLEAER